MFADRSMFQETSPHRFHAEASELGLRAGDWPDIETNLGNGLKLIPQRLDGQAVIYRQLLGCVEVVVYND
jgi:hypothetical protein